MIANGRLRSQMFFLQNRCYENFCNILGKALLLESLFNKILVFKTKILLACNFNKKDSDTDDFRRISQNFSEELFYNL